MTQKQFQKHKWQIDEEVYVVVYKSLCGHCYPASVEKAVISSITTTHTRQSKTNFTTLVIDKDSASTDYSSTELGLYYKGDEIPESKFNSFSFSLSDCDLVFMTEKQAKNHLLRLQNRNKSNICFFGESAIKRAQEYIDKMGLRLKEFESIYEECKSLNNNK